MHHHDPPSLGNMSIDSLSKTLGARRTNSSVAGNNF